MGIVSSHPGIGTIVARKPEPPRILQALSTADELAELYRRTKLRLIETDTVIADETLAEDLKCERGHEWSRSRLLRFVPGNPLPVSHAVVYLRPEYADIAPLIDQSRLPIFELLLKHHGLQLTEIRQRIVAVLLDERISESLKAPVGSAALRITRHFVGSQGRVVEVSVSTYAADRFVYESSYRMAREPSGAM